MTQQIEQKFESMGARVKVLTVRVPRTGRRWDGRRIPAAFREPFRVNVLHDHKGEYFEVTHREDVIVDVPDVRPGDRHLLLVSQANEQSKFLCGHDERAWFVAAIPETATVQSVQDAKDALKPLAVWESMREFGVAMEERDLRKTHAFVRQGEWFFIPRYDAPVVYKDVLRNEPIRRGAGKPHLCQMLFREGGEMVYVSEAHPNGLTVEEWRELTQVEREKEQWTSMARNPRVLVTGAVSHQDHETIRLKGWHEVVMNTETQARAMEQLAFLD